MRHWILNTKIRLLSALYDKEFRHLSHLSAHLDISYKIVHESLFELRDRGFLKTEKVRPVDADPTYKFTKIKLTTQGRRFAQICNELEESLNEFEENHE
jgi:DNA-binding HxlR family transcriptional regulator